MNNFDFKLINYKKFNKPIKDTKIVVAMSGGVDSSVVACLLKELGYQVIGITLQLYDIGSALKKKNACCAGVDIMDAKKVAWQFDFPHYVLNYQNLFKESVIDDFADSYLRGETPIPCVRCNQSVKFRDLMKLAKDLGADYLATGHYVRKISDITQNYLAKAIDDNKDQSYFLFATTKEQLDFLQFPLGGISKEETRNHAIRLGLEVSNKADSQDICFVPDGNYAKLVSELRPSAFKEGDIVHIASGKVLGRHNGIINFTIGQRRGLGISYNEPIYVVKISPKDNIVFVGEEFYLDNINFTVKNVNWLDGDYNVKINKNIPILARIRSNHQEEEANLLLMPDYQANITMKNHSRAITPGQACVFYQTRIINNHQQEIILGGGWIDKIIQ
jgi:tRNA-specific 2-thiouridylase